MTRIIFDTVLACLRASGLQVVDASGVAVEPELLAKDIAGNATMALESAMVDEPATCEAWSPAHGERQ